MKKTLGFMLALAMVCAIGFLVAADKGGNTTLYGHSTTSVSLGTGNQELNYLTLNGVSMSASTVAIKIYDARSTTVGATMVWQGTFGYSETLGTQIAVNRQFCNGIRVVVVPDSGDVTINANYDLLKIPKSVCN